MAIDRRVPVYDPLGELPRFHGRLVPAGVRLLAKVRFTAYGCWEWRASLNNNGYAVLFHHGKMTFAHRISYEAFVGPIPAGLVIDHLCRNRCCVNPDHLEAVTRSVNVSRGLIPSMNRQRAERRTHCPNGHPFDVVNTYLGSRDERQCRICRIAHARNYDQRTGRKLGRSRLT